MKWTNDDIEIVEKFIQIKNRGLYADGGQVTAVYNRVLEKSVPSTNCGSCIRQRINELEAHLQRFKKTMEVDNKEEENKAPLEAGNKPKGRTKKTQS